MKKNAGKSKVGGARPGAGRPKGTPNKVTTEIRKIFHGIMERNASKVEKWIETVAKTDPARATELLLKVAEFHLPKLSRVEVPMGEGGNIVQVIRLPRTGASSE